MGRLAGLLVLILGTLWLLSNLGVLPAWSIGEIVSLYWPSLLIFFGFVGMWNSRKHGFKGMFGFLFLATLAAGVQLDMLDILDFFSFVLPASLILVGLLLLFGKRRDSYGYSRIAYDTEQAMREVKDTLRDLPGDDLANRSMFGSLRVGGPGYKLEGQSYTHRVGDVKFDLRETEIPLGETVLEITCNIGDVDVWLPQDAQVWVQSHVKVGDVKVFDQRNSGANASLTYKSQMYEEAERKLKLLIWVKMGDIDVKRAE